MKAPIASANSATTAPQMTTTKGAPIHDTLARTTGQQAVPHVYLVDNSRMLADVGYELAPLEVRVLEHINDAREEAGLEAIAG